MQSNNFMLIYISFCKYLLNINTIKFFFFNFLGGYPENFYNMFLTCAIISIEKGLVVDYVLLHQHFKTIKFCEEKNRIIFSKGKELVELRPSIEKIKAKLLRCQT